MPIASDGLPPDRGVTEIADRCWVARHSWLDVNIGVVAGSRGTPEVFSPE